MRKYREVMLIKKLPFKFNNYGSLSVNYVNFTKQDSVLKSIVWYCGIIIPFPSQYAEYHLPDTFRWFAKNRGFRRIF